MLDADAAIHDDLDAGRFRLSPSPRMDNAQLEPEDQRPDRYGVFDDRRDMFRATEDVDEVNGVPMSWGRARNGSPWRLCPKAVGLTGMIR